MSKNNAFKSRLPPTDKQLWVTNISTQKDISIDDLRVKVPRCRSVNLLDRRHYSFTEDQIRKSLESGSLKRKAAILKVREGAPVTEKKKIDWQKKPRVLRKARNNVEIEAPKYEELDFEDETEAETAFAAEQAEADFADTAPALAVDKKYASPNVELMGMKLQTPDQYFAKKSPPPKKQETRQQSVLNKDTKAVGALKVPDV